MNDPFAPIEELKKNLIDSEILDDPFIQEIEKDLQFQDTFISSLYEELIDGHASLFSKLIKEKIQKTPFLITSEREKKRKLEQPFEEAKLPKYEDKQYFEIFRDIAIHTYSQPTRYTKEIFLKKMEFERIELLQALQKVKHEMTKEKQIEMKKKWKKILFHATETSKQWKENNITKIKNAKKFAQLCQKEVQSKEKKTEKLNKDSINRAKKLGKEVLVFWKKYEKESVERKKKIEKEEQERRKKEEEELEAKRQQRKLNFLLTQTELYSHFMSKKQNSQIQIKEDDNENDGLSQKRALELAQKAAQIQLEKTQSFDKEIEQITQEKTSVTFTDKKYGEPKCFIGNLKQYQIQGLNWLISLYEQGINGILADEMGLGKTIQCISFLGHLAEEKNIWGPHLIISPSSTLHNWVHEFEKFCPTLKVMPYWGNPNDRKTLRKFWNPKNLYTKNSPFHVVISSYGLILEDEKMFQKVKWQYLILDEAHSIKSVKSARWKTLLGLDVRNRLLLTGTPLQNNMQELWALLHFIMPSLFDSHEEFNEWFSKDIESHAKKSGSSQPSSLNEQQVQRLHLILKPFMLRRVKKDIEFEMVKKEEKTIMCKLSYRQIQLYKWIKDSIKNNKSSSETVLANYVMQLRKICNHPDLLEKLDVESPYQFQLKDIDISTNKFEVKCLNKNPIEMNIPKIVYRELMEEDNNQLPSLFNIFEPFNMKDNETFSFVNVMKKSIGEVSWLSKCNFFEQILYYHYQDKEETLPKIEQEPLIKELTTKYLKVLSPPIQFNVSDRSFSYKQYVQMNNSWIKNLLMGYSVISPKPYITLSVTSNTIIPNSERFENKRLIEMNDYIRIPNFENVLNGSGKLIILDQLLTQLFKRKDRVLIFSQMTKMMNILEDLMHYRNYKYLRLDGSTSISDRNEMVTAFQKRSDIFVFLLSTRAGGLGINLTSANTVIFYDSDWNPTSDAQAQDRCHRIGQTRPVTVYRLISEKSIEERILKVALQKSFIQETVYKGSIQPVENNKEIMMKLLIED